MSIGTGIFLSALFLGCIVLYVKSENKAKWRKCLLASLGGLVAAGVILFVGSSVYDAFEDDTPTSPFPKNTADHPTDMMGIRLGETLANLQFERGKFYKIPIAVNKQTGVALYLDNGEWKSARVAEHPSGRKVVFNGHDWVPFDSQQNEGENTNATYITDTNVIISEKEGRAEGLAYDCSNAPTDPATYFHKIQCGSTASDVMQAYGQNNVTVLCSDTEVETRLYDITGKNIRLWLTKNAVQRIEFSTQPFPPSETFKKRCL